MHEAISLLGCRAQDVTAGGQSQLGLFVAPVQWLVGSLADPPSLPRVCLSRPVSTINFYAQRAPRDCQIVLNCAGPFTRTFQPIADACVETHKHYLDITGEISVFEAAAAMDEVARKAGVTIMPGVGFDVVPTDCLAVHLKKRLPTATKLTLGIHAAGAAGASRGTTVTMVEHVTSGHGGLVRRDGEIVKVPLAHARRTLDHGYGVGHVWSSCIPWGDVSTAYRSTAIPNIEVYMGTPGVFGVAMWLASFSVIAWLLTTRVVAAIAHLFVPAWGPTQRAREAAMNCVYGEVTDERSGRTLVSRIRVAEGYTFTALASIRIVENVLFRLPRKAAGSGGHLKAGFQTPAMAYGPDLVLTVDGSTREDEPEGLGGTGAGAGGGAASTAAGT